MNIIEVEKSEHEFADELTDVYGVIEICGMKFDSGHALRELDPIAFRCAMSDQPLQYDCGECGKRFEEDEQDEAELCCKPEVA